MTSPIAFEVEKAPVVLNPSVMKLAAVRLQMHLKNFGGSFASIDDDTATEMAIVIANLSGPQEAEFE